MKKLAVLFYFVSLCSQAAPLPEQIHLKSQTRTFSRSNEYALIEGKIWFKPATRSNDWRLFGDTGLPGDSEATAIREISADGDSLIAITDAGRVFDAELSRDKIGALKITWNKGWGWPMRLAARPKA